MLIAYEALLSEAYGREITAGRTRRVLDLKGPRQCLADWAQRPTATVAFAVLIENGLADLTAEAIIVRNPHRFSSDVVTAARLRLDRCGVNKAD